jgi:hypothetical protein
VDGTEGEGVVAEIGIAHAGGDDYTVQVREGSSSTRHRVTVPSSAHTRFGGGAPVEALLEESFRFLLEREPKESILRQFEISVIASYFPEYPHEIRQRLGTA